MENYNGEERRKHRRLNANFIISYRIKEISGNYDLTQSRNVSQGGMLLTTNRQFDRGTTLAMTIRFPFVSERIELTGRVVGSREVVRDLIYETRIQFINFDQGVFVKLGEFIRDHFKQPEK